MSRVMIDILVGLIVVLAFIGLITVIDNIIIAVKLWWKE